MNNPGRKKYFAVLLTFLNFSMLYAQNTDENKSSFESSQFSQVRQISIAVTGAVVNPGTYILAITDRVDKAIQMANRSSRDNNEPEQDLLERRINRRNIVLYRRTGKTVKVDIQKYYALRDERWNPVLLDGDMIFVPKVEPKNIIAVYGGVNVPGKIEYSDSDRVSDAIHLAYGFTKAAMADSMILYRYDENENTLHEQIVRWSQVQTSLEQDILLQPGDRIVVQEREDLREDYHVVISGEVRFPGVYPITRDKTKLSSILEKAGGPTPYASLFSASVYRGRLTREEFDLEQLMSLRGNVAIEDSANFKLENELRLHRAVVDVDLEKLLVDHDTTQDIVLSDGDNIVLPAMVKTIYVYGQVVLPGNVAFQQGEKIEYYIAKAGGYTEHARKSDIMIIKGTTHQWLNPSETTIEKGDQIWVPMIPERTFAYYMSIFSQAATIITTAVSITLLVIQLK